MYKSKYVHTYMETLKRTVETVWKLLGAVEVILTLSN